MSGIQDYKAYQAGYMCYERVASPYCKCITECWKNDHGVEIMVAAILSVYTMYTSVS